MCFEINTIDIKLLSQHDLDFEFFDPVPWEVIIEATFVCLIWSGIFTISAFYLFNKKEILS